MFCSNCRKELSEDSNFCSSCGSKIEKQKQLDESPPSFTDINKYQATIHSGQTTEREEVKIERPTISSNANDINNIDMKMTMKKPIIVVTVLLSIGIAFSILDIASAREHGLGQFIGLGLEGLILYGLFKRNRLVWQWGRILAVFSIIMIVVSLVFIGASAIPLLVVPLIWWLIVFISFGTTSAKEHFNLICPNCSSNKVKANDFIFKKAKCKECNYIW